MSNPLKNRVFGVVGVRTKMANWNADFTGNPKTTSDGDIFGSDKAWKYSMKHYWNNNGEKLLYYKNRKLVSGKKGEDFVLRDLEESYEALFGMPLEENELAATKQLFQAIDVLNFGCTFATKKTNIGIAGAVQVGQGMNVYQDTDILTQDILSPFPSEKGKKQSSIGKKITVNEAQYLYPFSINPSHYDFYRKHLEGFNGYTEEAYESFKDAALVSATALNTNSKAGCQNDFAIFVKAKKDVPLYLPHLDQYISYSKEDGKGIYDLTFLAILIQDIHESIESVDVYVDPHLTQIHGMEMKDTVRLYNIYTKKEMQL